MYNVLVCDDDKAILDSLEIYLNLEGYKVFKAENGRQALKTAEENDLQCIILDIMMPDLDGLNATLKLRESKNIPIILLSAKSEDTDKITGLSFGADDYVTKPFNPLELMARVKSQIRRYVSLGSMEKKDSLIVTGGLALDLDSKEITLDGEKSQAYRYGIRHTRISYEKYRQSSLYESDIRSGVEGAVVPDGKNRDSAHTQNKRKNRDKSQRAEIFKGGVGHWLQNRKALKLRSD